MRFGTAMLSRRSAVATVFWSKMPNVFKQAFLGELRRRFPAATKLPASQSLYDLGGGQGRVYIRYSKTHPGNRTFFGLRKTDLQQLEGYHSVICFLWDNQAEPLLVRFSDFEDVFRSIQPADDGQFKVQVYTESEGTELYIANAGRFNVESFFGWKEVKLRASEKGSAADRKSVV